MRDSNFKIKRAKQKLQSECEITLYEDIDTGILQNHLCGGVSDKQWVATIKIGNYRVIDQINIRTLENINKNFFTRDLGEEATCIWT